MKNTFKKAVASVMAVAAMAVSAVGVSASAADVGSINLHKAAGAPGSATVTYQSWNFTTAANYTTMSMGDISRSSGASSSSVHLKASTGINVISSAKTTAGSSYVDIGEYASASAELLDFSYGTHSVSGTVRG